MIYLDNAATTQMYPEVVDAMMPYLTNMYGNPGATYSFGKLAASAIENAREQVADFINAKPEQIIFTSGGTEANNLAIKGCKEYLKKVNKTVILSSKTEHDSVLNAIDELCKSFDKTTGVYDFCTQYVKVDKYGHIPVDSFCQLVSRISNIGLATVMCVNNEVGVMNDIRSVGQICKENHILFSSHKIHGAQGVGALYVENKEYLEPMINGGATQEFGIRGGTPNVAGIIGFGKACEITKAKIKEDAEMIIKYKELFYSVLIHSLNNAGVRDCVTINGLLPRYNGKILNLTFNGIDSETLLLMLGAKGVCISAGSACRSHESKPSRVLKAIGLSDDDARSSVRISFSSFNTLEEVEIAAKTIAESVAILSGGNL